MKILFVSYKLSGGGAERVISVLSNQMIEMGHSVGVLLYKRTQDEYVLNKNVDVLELEKYYSESVGNAISRKLKRILGIRKLILEYAPDVVIPFLDSMVTETYHATRGMKLKLIATVRNHPLMLGTFERIYRDYVFEKCQAVFLQTENQSKFLRKKIREKAFVVPNPVDEKILEMGKNREEHVLINRIVTCGRLEKQKNHRLLIEAVQWIHNIYPEVTLSIYGEGNEKEKLQELIHEYRAEKYIFLMGRSNNIGDVLNQADLFVLSSDYEGMPNALMEAMACGVPCISTDCPTGPQELIGHNERGILIPVGEVEKLRNAICEMIEDSTKATLLGEKAHIYLQSHFSPSKIAGKLLMEITQRGEK